VTRVGVAMAMSSRAGFSVKFAGEFEKATRRANRAAGSLWDWEESTRGFSISAGSGGLVVVIWV
jgi:hypothetical protein